MITKQEILNDPTIQRLIQFGKDKGCPVYIDNPDIHCHCVGGFVVDRLFNKVIGVVIKTMYVELELQCIQIKDTLVYIQNVILHELGHFIDCDKLGINEFVGKDTYDKEVDAWDYAEELATQFNIKFSYEQRDKCLQLYREYLNMDEAA